jgi:hypothetical protein
MSVLRRYASLRRLQVVLGLALMGLVFAPSASGAAQLDTATATGSGSQFSNINISAQSGTSGQNPSGTASFTVFGSFQFSGPVTCLTVTGPDRGGGTSSAPTTAVLNFQNTTGTFAGNLIQVQLVDNGGNGADRMTFAFANGQSPSDCSPTAVLFTDTLSNGRAVVFDAPILPTSKDQCKDGGWQSFGVFKNQGDCVSFVATHGKNPPG